MVYAKDCGNIDLIESFEYSSTIVSSISAFRVCVCVCVLYICKRYLFSFFWGNNDCHTQLANSIRLKMFHRYIITQMIIDQLWQLVWINAGNKKANILYPNKDINIIFH